MKFNTTTSYTVFVLLEQRLGNAQPRNTGLMVELSMPTVAEIHPSMKSSHWCFTSAHFHCV